ncbi:SagB/ThcOx family dehydrogenase [bacterium]|nr:SagB/ThcOx family dehydrogenase [bacterium]
MNEQEREERVRLLLQRSRNILKNLPDKLWPEGHQTDQQLGKPAPPLQKPAPDGATLIDLTPPDELTLGQTPLLEVINSRRSRRKFTDESLTLEELSYLLWCTRGVQKVFAPNITLRTVPSGGARHPFDTYMLIERVEGLAKGLYRYQPLEHQLCLIYGGDDLYDSFNEALGNQGFGGAVLFVWVAIPYRCEWRYSLIAHRGTSIDAGHIGQSLYLAAESIGCGTCTLAAFSQDKLNKLLQLDGDDEFAYYAAPVGRKLDK